MKRIFPRGLPGLRAQETRGAAGDRRRGGASGDGFLSSTPARENNELWGASISRSRARSPDAILRVVLLSLLFSPRSPPPSLPPPSSRSLSLRCPRRPQNWMHPIFALSFVFVGRDHRMLFESFRFRARKWKAPPHVLSLRARRSPRRRVVCGQLVRLTQR